MPRQALEGRVNGKRKQICEEGCALGGEAQRGWERHQQKPAMHGSSMRNQFAQKPDIDRTPARSAIACFVGSADCYQINAKPHAHSPFAAIEAEKVRAIRAGFVGSVSQTIYILFFQTNGSTKS